jgi:hypothetical protein
MAQRRVQALAGSEDFKGSRDWGLEFHELLELVLEERADEFRNERRTYPLAVRQDCCAEAGFVLGLEIGKLIERRRDESSAGR